MMWKRRQGYILHFLLWEKVGVRSGGEMRTRRRPTFASGWARGLVPFARVSRGKVEHFRMDLGGCMRNQKLKERVRSFSTGNIKMNGNRPTGSKLGTLL